jgi:hypothetical protein
VEEVSSELVKALEEIQSRTCGIADEMTYYEIDTARMVDAALEMARGVALLETTIRDNLEHSIGEFLLSHARKTVALALDEEQIPDHGQAALLMYAGSYLECAGEEIMSGKWRTQ